MAKSGQIRVGMSGWTFEPWRGDFYPKGLTQKNELGYASRKVSSIEINGTFYSLQRPTTFQSWYEQVPEDFVFAVKAPQFITHVRRMKDVGEPLANFFASGLLCLRKKLGPILWQLPPNLTLKDDRFEKFFELLPHDSREAERLARKHSDKVKGRAWLEAGGDYEVRHAIEFRHPSFRDAKFLKLMREHGIAVVFAQDGLKSPRIEDVTADFVYARMHGEDKRFKKGYTPKALASVAGRFEAWARGAVPKGEELLLKPARAKARDVYVYFDTEAKAYAPFDALNLMKRLK